ncbi:cadherin-like domain-containing protein [Bacteroidota bacterium]
MKKFTNSGFIVLIALILFSIDMNGQGITIGTGTTFSLGGATFSLSGSWNNSGTFTAGNGTVIFNGPSGDQSITNSSGETFNNLTINKAADDVVLQNDVEITGTLKLTSGDIDLNGKIITLGAAADLDESAGATVKGTSGYITATRYLNAPNNVDVAGLGAVITTTADMDTTEIRRGHADQSCGSVYRYYDISPTMNTGLNATLVFNYDDSELNGITETDLQVFSSIDAGATWLRRGGSNIAANNYNELTGIDSFSRWTLAVNNPPLLADIEADPLAYSEDDPATPVTASISLSDSDDVTIKSGIVEITGNYQAGEDVLEFTDFSNITGSWNSANGTMTLTGTDSKANYLTALQNIHYENLLDNPTYDMEEEVERKTGRVVNATPRTVSFTVNDGDKDSNIITRDINITPKNDVPIVVNNLGAVLDEGNSITIPQYMLRSEDPDGSSYVLYTIQTATVNGVLRIAGTALNAGSTFTQNDINELRLTYAHDGSETTYDSFEFNVSDFEGIASQNQIFEFQINPVFAPIIPPTNISCTPNTDGYIVLRWIDNSDNELGFYLWRETNTTAKQNITYDYELIATLPANTEEYIDENIEEGASYTYRISAFNDEGDSEIAQGDDGGETETSAPLATPTNLQGRDNGDFTIVIEWEDNSSLETGYKIERTTTDIWEEIYTTVENETSYTDADIEGGITYLYRIKAFNNENESVYSNECSASCTMTGIEEWTNGTPTEFTLHQNYPNPFNPNTIIRYGLQGESHVKLVVYNLLGQQITTLVDQIMSAGYHEVTFNASNVNSGIYLYKIEAGDFRDIKKMIFLK